MHIRNNSLSSGTNIYSPFADSSADLEAANDIILINASAETEDEKKERQFKEELQRHIISMATEYPDDENIFEIQGVKCFAKGDLVSIKAKQKQGKSLLISILISTITSSEWGTIKCLMRIDKALYIDTEMKAKDTQLINRKALKMAGKEETDIEGIKFINLRDVINPETMLKMVGGYIKMFMPEIVFIDGIVDLVGDFNDVTESQRVMRELIFLAEIYNCCIVSVLHTNKNAVDHNMRGHLGTISCQKSSHVFECVKKDEIVTVKCTDSRHAPVPDFSFGFDNEGVPFNANDVVKKMEATQKENSATKKDEKDTAKLEERKKKIADIIKNNGGRIKKSELVKALVNSNTLSQTCAYNLINELTPEFICVTSDGFLSLSSAENQQQKIPSKTKSR